MLQLRVAKVWMLADGRPESQGKCLVLWIASRCVSMNDEWFNTNLLASVDLCKCWTSIVRFQIPGAQDAEVRPSPYTSCCWPE